MNETDHCPIPIVSYPIRASTTIYLNIYHQNSNMLLYEMHIQAQICQLRIQLWLPSSPGNVFHSTLSNNILLDFIAFGIYQTPQANYLLHLIYSCFTSDFILFFSSAAILKWGCVYRFQLLTSSSYITWPEYTFGDHFKNISITWNNLHPKKFLNQIPPNKNMNIKQGFHRETF